MAIVNSIVAMGKSLHLTITAEGVETPSQAQALRKAGCDQAQGYLFGRPLSETLANVLANGVPGSPLASADLISPFLLATGRSLAKT